MARAADGHLEVVARATDDTVAHVRVGGAWTTLGGGTIASDPVVIANADGRLEVFARAPSGRFVTWFEQTGAGWSSMYPIATFAFAGNPRAGWTADGRIEIMARGNDGALWHAWQGARVHNGSG